MASAEPGPVREPSEPARPGNRYLPALSPPGALRFSAAAFIGQDSRLAQGGRDVPGVDGGVQGAGRRGDRSGQVTLRQRCRHRLVVGADRGPG